VHWLDYYHIHVIMSTWYYKSCCIQQTWNESAKCISLRAPKYALKYTPDCTRLYTASLRDLHSQEAPKYSQSTLPHTSPSTFSSALSVMLSRTLPIALDGTPPACLTVRSQVSSKDTLKHTPKHIVKYTSNCTRWHTPSLLDICCQAHSKYAPKYTSEHILKYTPRHVLQDAPNWPRCHTPSLFDCTLPSKLSRYS